MIYARVSSKEQDFNPQPDQKCDGTKKARRKRGFSFDNLACWQKNIEREEDKVTYGLEELSEPSTPSLAAQ